MVLQDCLASGLYVAPLFNALKHLIAFYFLCVNSDSADYVRHKYRFQVIRINKCVHLVQMCS